MGTCCTTIESSSVGIVERWGKFVRTANPGFNCLNCCCGESIAGIISLRINQLDLKVETKTEDDVFVHVHVAVQYQVARDKIRESFYTLSSPDKQIEAHVAASIRAHAPSVTLDNLFKVKEKLAAATKEELERSMKTYGYEILDVLVVDIDPDHRVKDAMNEVKAAERARVAAISKAETEKLLLVKKAEAEAESMHLAGKGMALARAEIVHGLEENVQHFSQTVSGATPQDIIHLVLATQYFDAMKEIGAQSKSNIIYIPHSPNPDLGEHMRQAILSSPVLAMPPGHSDGIEAVSRHDKKNKSIQLT